MNDSHPKGHIDNTDEPLPSRAHMEGSEYIYSTTIHHLRVESDSPSHTHRTSDNSLNCKELYRGHAGVYRC